MAGADRIELTGLRVMARCGVLPEEVARAQPFEVDLVIEADLSAAGSTDELEATIDYGAIVDDVVAVTQGHRNLMERFATQIADVVFHGRPGVGAVEVRVRKLRPPVAHDLGTAAVSVRRTPR